MFLLLDTEKAPQSWIGRFNKVIGGVYQDTDVVEKVLGVQMRKGVVKVSDKMGIEQRLVLIEGFYE